MKKSHLAEVQCQEGSYKRERERWGHQTGWGDRELGWRCNGAMVWPSQMTSRKMLAHDASLPHMPALFRTPVIIWYRLLGTKWQHSWPCFPNVQTSVFRNEGEKLEGEKNCSVSGVYLWCFFNSAADNIQLFKLLSCLSYWHVFACCIQSLSCCFSYPRDQTSGHPQSLPVPFHRQLGVKQLQPNQSTRN